jgi:Cellulase (glycosyl hydrolase family 5)
VADFIPGYQVKKQKMKSAFALRPVHVRSKKLNSRHVLCFAVAFFAVLLTAVPALARTRWTQQEANTWYAGQTWPVGSDYIPANAINQLEMWQQDTFDPARIDLELGWAQSIGMNTMRVFLHDLLFEQDQKGFEQRIDTFLTIAQKHHIRPVLVLFDSCWDPFPKLGPQRPPIPGVHNSGWVQSPGAEALTDVAQYPRLERYVKGIVGNFANDPRILAWDLWNEPDNDNGGKAGAFGRNDPSDKEERVAKLLPEVFTWARSVNPSQPLTSGIWKGDWSSDKSLSTVARIQVTESDVISFHNYSWPEDFEQRVRWLQRYDRPLLCTEYMARGAGSTFDTILPIAKQYKVGAINWGLVAGKTQTYLPWDSWQHPYILEQPPVWFHEVFHTDGKPYRERETEIIRNLTGATAAASTNASATGNSSPQ